MTAIIIIIELDSWTLLASPSAPGTMIEGLYFRATESYMGKPP